MLAIMLIKTSKLFQTMVPKSASRKKKENKFKKTLKITLRLKIVESFSNFIFIYINYQLMFQFEYSFSSTTSYWSVSSSVSSVTLNLHQYKKLYHFLLHNLAIFQKTSTPQIFQVFSNFKTISKNVINKVIDNQIFDSKVFQC